MDSTSSATPPTTPPKLSYDKLDAYVKANWKPNVTMLDYDWYAAVGDDHVALSWDLADTLNQLYGKHINMDEKNDSEPRHATFQPPNPTSLFDWYAYFFHAVAKSLQFLTRDTNCFQLDARVGDVNDTLSHLHLEAMRNAAPGLSNETN